MGVEQLRVLLPILLVGQVDGDTIRLEQLRQSAAMRENFFVLPKCDVLLAQRDGPLFLTFAWGCVCVLTHSQEEKVRDSN